ncbi:MAG: hypothetical protein C0500_02245 [Sphingobium sp.]|nr:hypothetical protein [Sphingobium sp.]
MQLKMRARMASAAMLGGVVLTAAGSSKPSLHVLGAIEHGQWELREQGVTSAPRTLCLGDPDALVQIQHAQQQCARFVVDDQPMAGIVTYDCKGAGRGRTVIRAESPRLIHVDTQGLAGGAPFDMSFEGRRTGACAATAR